MKVLLDTCIWGGSREVVIRDGHDVVWAGEWSRDPGDEQILNIAHQEGRILVTLDKDFGELAVVRGQPHNGIVRIVGFSARDQGSTIVAALRAHGIELESGAIVTVEPGRVRLRPAQP